VRLGIRVWVLGPSGPVGLGVFLIPKCIFKELENSRKLPINTKKMIKMQINN
jgi:hypothetical protein